MLSPWKKLFAVTIYEPICPHKNSYMHTLSDDYDKPVATSRFEGKPTKEMSDYAEELCEDSDEDPQNAGKYENFLPF